MTEKLNVLDGPELSDVKEHFRRAAERLSAEVAADPSDINALVKRAVVYRTLGGIRQGVAGPRQGAKPVPLRP